MMDFLHPAWLWGALPILILHLIARRGAPERRPEVMLIHPLVRLLPAARRHDRGGGRWLWLLPMAAQLLIVASLAQPRWLGPPQAANPEGRDMVLLVDLSKSMSIGDFKVGDEPVERLTVLKHLVTQFISGRTADRVGIIAFGNQAATLVPPTYDRAFAIAMLDRVSVGMLGDNTAMGDAIGLALKQLPPAQQRPALILFSDGDNTAGALTPAEAIVLAQRQRASIYAVEIGSDLFAAGRAHQGTDASVMSQLAQETGGRYYRAADAATLERVMRDIDALEKTVAPPKGPPTARDAYIVPLLLAIALLTLHAGYHGRPRAAFA